MNVRGVGVYRNFLNPFGNNNKQENSSHRPEFCGVSTKGPNYLVINPKM